MKIPLRLVLFLAISTSLGAEIQSRTFTPTPIRIELDDLPKPNSDESADKQPEEAEIPSEPTLEVPAGFRVDVFADEQENARWLALTPDGDVLLARSRDNEIVLLRDTSGDGKADEASTFGDKSNAFNLPFGMAFTDGHFFVGNTNAVRRYPWKKGQRKLEGEGEEITSLPGQGYNQHWTRNVVASPTADWLYVSVGSESNVDEEEPPRASILRIKPDGTGRENFATGLRNPVGMDFHPETADLYATVNERDKLGDDLVPDYLARVVEGAFYGWPYAYLSPLNLDPRRMKDGESENAALALTTQTPDVLFESHSAALGLAFAKGTMFPEKYRNGAFVAFRGSWNRSTGTGYKIVFVPFGKQGRAEGHYEDFVRGFLIDPDVPRTWGRPVGTLFLPDGSLLFTDEMKGRVYRVSYEG